MRGCHFIQLETPTTWLHSATPSHRLICHLPSIHQGRGFPNFHQVIASILLIHVNDLQYPTLISSVTSIMTPAIPSGASHERPPLKSQAQASRHGLPCSLTPAASASDVTEATGSFCPLLLS